jgi:hypothetical protein
MKKDKILHGNQYININRKSTSLIVLLIVIGIITGVVVSNYFLIDANKSIQDWNEGIDKWYDRWNNSSDDNCSWWNNWNWNNTENETKPNLNNTSRSSDMNNTNWSGFFDYLSPLTYQDVILPIITVILLCISSYFLLALNVTYAKIYLDTKSKYILGLLLVLIPLQIVSIFFIRIVKSLFFSSALEYNMLSSILGFGINGLGGMLSIISMLMILGFGILLYLSNE